MEEAGFADWDLLAVVRSCSATTATSSTEETDLPPRQLPPPLSPQPKQAPFFLSPPLPTSSSSEHIFRFPALFEPNTTSFLAGQHELQDVCSPCSVNNNNNTPNFQSLYSSSVSSSLTSSSSSSSVIAGIGEPPQLRRIIRPSQVVFGAPNQQPPRTKKRRNLMKKVCHAPAEGLSNDMWAWRKYGQKPIKGSPYPRGYYRCSSSKGCLARKQVERNRSDPKMFIVTYTGEHNHPMPTQRNSLAGSTRQKPLSASAGDTPPADQTCSSPSAASLSPPTTEKSESKSDGEELMKEELEEDNDMGFSDLMLNDDFYVGFEKIDGEDTDDCFSDHFSPPMELPWLLNCSSSSTATATGGI